MLDCIYVGQSDSYIDERTVKLMLASEAQLPDEHRRLALDVALDAVRKCGPLNKDESYNQILWMRF